MTFAEYAFKLRPGLGSPHLQGVPKMPNLADYGGGKG